MAQSMGQRTAQSAKWIFLQTLGVKGVNLVGQIFLAHLLTPTDFGLIGLAFTAITIASVLQGGGIREIMLARGKNIGRWVNTGFWLSLCVGLIAGAGLAIAAPILAHAYNAPILLGMLGVSAATLCINNFYVVPRVILESQFKYKVISAHTAIVETIRMMATLGFAWMGFGPFSIIWSVLLTNLFSISTIWWLARPPVRFCAPFRHANLMLPNMVPLSASLGLTALIWQGDYIMLGLLTSPELVGLYFLGFTLAQQTIYLFVSNLSPLMLTSLGYLKTENEKQLDVALRLARILAFTAVPLCLLQAVLAEPFIKAFYTTKWYESIIVLTILSVGMIGRVLDPVSENLINAKGRYRLLMWLAAGHGATLILALYWVAPTQNLVWISLAVAASLIFWGVLRFVCSVRLAGGSASMLAIYLLPLFLSGVALGAALWLTSFMTWPPTRLGHLGQMALVTLLSATIYLGLARRLLFSTWQDLARGLRQSGLGKFVGARKTPE